MPDPRVVLVLGAGGITGGAYEYGVLMALHERTGWEPSGATAFIGTSAGSWIAAFLAAGRSMADVIALARPPAPRGNLLQRTADRVNNVALGDASGLYTPHVRLPRISPFWWARPGGLLAESGLYSSDGMARRLRARLPEAHDRWPHPALRIAAVDTRRLRRVVFGTPGAPAATLTEAVTASSAIPGVFRPVEIGGVPYLDGGIASTTNLDLAGEFAAVADLVICIAPMAGDRTGGRPPIGPAVYGRLFSESLAWIARRQLEREVARVRAQCPDLDVLIVRPSAEDRRVMGVNAMDGRRREAVRAQAHQTALRMLDGDEPRSMLARAGLMPRA